MQRSIFLCTYYMYCENARYRGGKYQSAQHTIGNWSQLARPVTGCIRLVIHEVSRLKPFYDYFFLGEIVSNDKEEKKKRMELFSDFESLLQFSRGNSKAPCANLHR
jgi:hypothetical protein